MTNLKICGLLPIGLIERLEGAIDLELGQQRHHGLHHKIVNLRLDLGHIVAVRVHIIEHGGQLSFAALASVLGLGRGRRHCLLIGTRRCIGICRRLVNKFVVFVFFIN